MINFRMQQKAQLIPLHLLRWPKVPKTPSVVVELVTYAVCTYIPEGARHKII